MTSGVRFFIRRTEREPNGIAAASKPLHHLYEPVAGLFIAYDYVGYADKRRFQYKVGAVSARPECAEWPYGCLPLRKDGQPLYLTRPVVEACLTPGQEKTLIARLNGDFLRRFHPCGIEGYEISPRGNFLKPGESDPFSVHEWLWRAAQNLLRRAMPRRGAAGAPKPNARRPTIR